MVLVQWPISDTHGNTLKKLHVMAPRKDEQEGLGLSTVHIYITRYSSSLLRQALAVSNILFDKSREGYIGASDKKCD